MNIVIGDPKTGKTYSVTSEKPAFLNKKIGDEVELGNLGLSGYKAQITGGSDKDGFPMKPTLVGTVRRRVLIGKGTGFRATRKGERKRITVRGNTIAEDIHQVNLRITHTGSVKLEEVIGKKEAKKEEKEKK